MLNLQIHSTRLPFGPPMRLDWQGSMGPFESKEKAEELVAKIKESEKAKEEPEIDESLWWL